VPNRDLARQVIHSIYIYMCVCVYLYVCLCIHVCLRPPSRALISRHHTTQPHQPPHQVTSEIESLGQYLEPKLRIKCCVGSPNVKTEEARDERIALVKSLKTEPPHVLVGTMGRICDLAEGRDRSGPVIWCVGALCVWWALGRWDGWVSCCRRSRPIGRRGGFLGGALGGWILPPRLTHHHHPAQSPTHQAEEHQVPGPGRGGRDALRLPQPRGGHGARRGQGVLLQLRDAAGTGTEI
jgi:hypothetical protein